jgi:hypothetical protein
MRIFDQAYSIIDIDKYHNFPIFLAYSLPPLFSDFQRKSVLCESVSLINKYYSGRTFVDVGFQHNILIGEILKNAREHGGSISGLSTTYFGLFMNANTLCLGCNDGGDYFKNKFVKRLWENKFDLSASKDLGDFSSMRGYSYMKSRLDEIVIDDSEGTFYGVINIDRFLDEFPSNN